MHGRHDDRNLDQGHGDRDPSLARQGSASFAPGGGPGERGACARGGGGAPGRSGGGQSAGAPAAATATGTAQAPASVSPGEAPPPRRVNSTTAMALAGGPACRCAEKCHSDRML